ncbi:MAG: magnesium transporter [Pseudomonadota bacterium]|nr:magnesium transporter [Pseudomonadota bacterium]
MNDKQNSEINTNKLIQNISNNDAKISLNQISLQLQEMRPSEIAHSIESLPPKERRLIWSLLDTSTEGEILAELHDEIQQELMSEIKSDELVEIISDLEIDELVDILQNLPKVKVESVLSKIAVRDSERIRTVLEYSEDSAGGLLNTDVISVRPRHSLEVVMRYLRSKKELPNNTDKIFVVSRDDKYLGELPVSKLLVSEPRLTVRELMETEVKPIAADTNDKEVAKLFEQNDWVSAPVVDEEMKLLGRITVDDVVDVIIEDADQNLIGLAGIAEDTFAPPGRAAKSRALWLSINLLTAFIAAATINLFQTTIDKFVYLAVLMPIVASMGGVAATQTLTIVIRGLSLEQIKSSNLNWLFKRELIVSILNGIFLSILISIVTYFWFQELLISILICAAIVINLISSVIAGIFVPIILNKLNQDPAIAGSVVVTTVTDVIGFFSFLGLATIFLVN